MLKKRVKYYIHKDGKQKFASFNFTFNIHPNGTKMFANLGHNGREPQCYDLPKDGYPYTMEYEK